MQACCYILKEPTSCKALHAFEQRVLTAVCLLSHTAHWQWVDRQFDRGMQPPRLLHGPCGGTSRGVAAARGATPHRLAGAAPVGQSVRGRAQPCQGVRSSPARGRAQPCQSVISSLANCAPSRARVGVSDPARGCAQLEGRDCRAQARRGGRPARVGRRAAGEVQLPGGRCGGRHHVQAVGQAELVPAARRGRAERANARAAHGEAGLEEALRARVRGGCSALAAASRQPWLPLQERGQRLQDGGRTSPNPPCTKRSSIEPC